MQYVRLCDGVTDRGKLVDPSLVHDIVFQNGGERREWFVSHFYYDEIHYKQFEIKRSVAGFHSLKTDKLLFDFDCKDDLDKAKKDTRELFHRLVMEFNFEPNNIQLTFSGNKGFHIVVDIDDKLNAVELKTICSYMARGLETLDPVIYNDNRIIRVMGTRHNKTNLYKIPLTLEALEDDKFTSYAVNPEGMGVTFEWGVQHFKKEEILKLAKSQEPKEVKETITTDIKWDEKPKEWKNCKWSLLQGYYPEGKRNEALMIIVSTCRALGYDKETAYYLAKSSLKKRESRLGLEFSKEELWDTVIEPIYSPVWQGGQYTCRQDGWLKDYCCELGIHRCEAEEEGSAVSIHDVSNLFQDYADNFSKNIITTGIADLDENKNCKLMMGTFNGLVAPPGSSKSTLALQIMKHLSSKGIDSLFFSYDMFHSLVYTRMIQTVTGLHSDDIFRTFTSNFEEARSIKEEVQEAYKNVHFCFKQGQSSDDIANTIDATEAKIGRKIKFVVVDYNELVSSKYSDPVQAGSEVAQKLRQIAHDKQVCVLSLLQPSKLYSNPADEIDSYKSVKGATTISQAMSLLLGMSRPGFNPRNPEDDRFITISALKNRGGALFSVDLSWDGVSGKIGKLSYEEKQQLERVRRERDERREENERQWSN